MSSKTPKKRITVPSEYIFMNEKWQGSSLSEELKSKCRGCCYEDLGVVDFLTSSDCPVLFLTEADMLSPTIYKNKLKAFSNEYHGKGNVIICRNSSTQEAFYDVQKLAVIHLCLTIIPITSQYDLPELLSKMTKMESNNAHNPYIIKRRKEEIRDIHAQQIALMSMIPGVREAKALRLLKTFGTITAISSASFQNVSDVVGNSVARSVKDFFSN